MWKISRTSKVSSSAVAKTIKRYDETDSHEDRHRKEIPRVTSAAEDKLISDQVQISAYINTSQSSSNRHISTSTVRGDCVNQAFMVELLQRNHY